MEEKLNIFDIFKQIAFLQFVITKTIALKELETLKFDFELL